MKTENGPSGDERFEVFNKVFTKDVGNRTNLLIYLINSKGIS
jgi:hypothetical protein